jgi:Fic family protein
MAIMTQPNQIAAMEPMLPRHSLAEIQELSQRIIYTAGGLSRLLAPKSAESVATLLSEMNSYYSNLIEGHRTYPGELSAALQADFSAHPKKAALRQLGEAHIEVETLMTQRLADEPELEVCSTDFLCWLHQVLYQRLPEEFCTVKDAQGASYPVTPGALRDHPANVGHHVAPAPETLPDFLMRFQQAYSLKRIAPTERLMAAAAAHHRLMWIHPFADGNGRVVRLFTQAYLIKMGINGKGLWSTSRGLARAQTKYYDLLQNADATRQGDRDGRGALSESALREFCEFFLESMLDQIQFMDELLDLTNLERRIENHFDREHTLDGARSTEPALRVIIEVLRQGELARGKVGTLIGKSERTATTLLKKLQEAGYLKSEGPKKPVSIAFPDNFRDSCFPRLYMQ